MKVWLVQMPSQVDNKEENLRKILDYVGKGLQSGANIICFPEQILAGYIQANFHELAESIPGPATEKVAEMIKGKHTYVAFGMPEVDKETMYNAVPLIGPDGVIGVARKLYLATFTSPTSLRTSNEKAYFKPGENFGVFDTEFGKIGIHICLDLYFPEVARALALAGAWLILDPSGTPIRKVGPQLETISTWTASRAVENVVYWCYVNTLGEQKGTRFMGGSHLVDPTKPPGEGVVKVASVYNPKTGEDAKEEVLELELDSAPIHKLRHFYPMLRDARPELFEKLYHIARKRQHDL